jgi:hypothetical protein
MNEIVERRVNISSSELLAGSDQLTQAISVSLVLLSQFFCLSFSVVEAKYVLTAERASSRRRFVEISRR